MANTGTAVANASVDVDYDIEHEGTKIKLPAEPKPMATETAIKVLQRKLKDEQTILEVYEHVIGHPNDVLVAINAAMKEIYGWASPTATPGFFGKQPPELVTVKTGPKEADKIQVPSGSFMLPGIENPIQVHLRWAGGADHGCTIYGEVRKREKSILTELAAKARQILKDASIFRGKALRLQCDDEGNVSFNSISYLETDYIRPNDLILNPDEMQQIVASLWTPITNTDECLKHNIPLKRGVLLEGTYGTGKTMTANTTSAVCVENGWTYIMLDDVRGLKDTMLFAQRYQPCVVFAEDIDRVAEDRDQDGNDLLNVVDGVLTKNSQVMLVLSTNHVEKINPAMLRPGRLDAVVTINPPGEEAVKRLFRLYGGNLIDQSDELVESAAAAAGNIPATLREIVERSKLSMIADGRTCICDEDLRISAVGMTGHLNLLSARKPQISKEEAFGKAAVELLGAHDADDFEDAIERVENAGNKAISTARAVNKAVEANLSATKSAAGTLSEKITSVKGDTDKIKKAVGA